MQRVWKRGRQDGRCRKTKCSKRYLERRARRIDDQIPALTGRAGINHSTDCGDPIHRKSTTSPVLANRLLVRGKVNTIDLVASHITVQPLDSRAHVVENANRFPGNLL